MGNNKSKSTKGPESIVGSKMPDFDLELLDGTKTKFHEWAAGSIVFVDFYASWWGGCHPASKEVEKLNNDSKYKDKCKFLLVNIEDANQKEACESFKK